MTTNSAALPQNLETLYREFQQAVIDKIQLSSSTGQILNYINYLAAPADTRTNDEANAVDNQFTRYLLEWLGFVAGNWSYNLQKKAVRPDYVVRGAIGTAFVVEDKSSGLDLEPKHYEQIRKYISGTAGYAIWTNMRRIVALRFISASGQAPQILADINLEIIFINNDDSEKKQIELNNLSLFKLLFSKARFTNFTDLVDKIAIEENQFLSDAIPLSQDRTVTDEFIGGSREALNNLKDAALFQINRALEEKQQASSQENELKAEWDAITATFLGGIAYEIQRTPIQENIEILKLKIGELDKEAFSQLRLTIPATAALISKYDIWEQQAGRINGALLALRNSLTETRRIYNAFEVWAGRQSDDKDITNTTYAEQVAYVFFVRLLLVRVLEDKQILKPRLASDGGFLEWKNYVHTHFQELAGIGILNENFVSIFTRKAGLFYLHFFQQMVFDWFNPDDFLLVKTLEFLSRYNFKDVSSDIIGFTYEKYIERTAKARKGHFLTSAEVVEYMLDLLGYSGREVIGKKLLDPACGSGSFLVHAARRYRKALVESFLDIYNLADEAALNANEQLRYDLAEKYIGDLSALFYGLELNPFGCYLAEMNLLIQVLDDLLVLQAAGNRQGIERFQVFNTNSLDLPREVLVSSIASPTFSIPERISDSLIDEAFPLKARQHEHERGFAYIICNPPYVTPKNEKGLSFEQYSKRNFFAEALSGDINLYLLFLRLGLYYLANDGQMVYIVPLTVFGDRSAGAIRKILSRLPYKPTAAIRFFRGDVLFPEVDQAVGIVRVANTINNETYPDDFLVGGGATVAEAKNSHIQTTYSAVIKAVPANSPWQGNWLVTANPESLSIWQQVKICSDNFTHKLGDLLGLVFAMKQGDVNATHVNPLRVKNRQGNFAAGDVAIYKGENVLPFAPLPTQPADWAEVAVNPPASLDANAKRVYETLKNLKTLSTVEVGIILREVARLNTREKLTATWYSRENSKPLAFTHELWRLRLTDSSQEKQAKAILALLGSKVTVYLYNLFSTNNHVNKDELERIPIPEPTTFPQDKLTTLTDKLLTQRALLETDFVQKYKLLLPEFAEDSIALSPVEVLKKSNLPNSKLADLELRGNLKNLGNAGGKIGTLLNSDSIQVRAANDAFSKATFLILHDPQFTEITWVNAKNTIQLPDVAVAAQFLTHYQNAVQSGQTAWDKFNALQKQVDEIVADWYGFTQSQKDEIAAGLAWARRNRPPAQPTRLTAPTGNTTRQPVTSSFIAAIGYDAASKTLEVEMKDKSVIQYSEVPDDIYQKFSQEASLGNFYNKKIKGKFSPQNL